MRRHLSPIGVPFRRALFVTAIVAVAGCSAMTSKHGFVPLPEDLAQMQVGTTTRAETIALVGPPTTTGTVNSDILYYVESERDRFGPFQPQTVRREVVAISFTPAGVLQNIERFGLEDGRVVVLSRRITEDGITDVTFIGQLLGSLGRIDAGQLLTGEGPLSDNGLN